MGGPGGGRRGVAANMATTNQTHYFLTSLNVVMQKMNIGNTKEDTEQVPSEYIHVLRPLCAWLGRMGVGGCEPASGLGCGVEWACGRRGVG